MVYLETMWQESLGFESPDEAPLKRELGEQLASLANDDIRIGTSCWKYPGWVGQIYSRSRYLKRDRFSETAFKADCLTEYAETFKTVCVDAAFYGFPNARRVQEMAAQVPRDFEFSFKVTDQITTAVWPRHPRYGKRGGNPNEHFLNAEAFKRHYLEPLSTLGPKLGVLVFEFSPTPPRTFESPKAFAERLDAFFQQLPTGPRYAVELRNRELLGADYFRVLKARDLTHCLNSWTRMPPIEEQLTMPGALDGPACVARFLLKPGRKFEEAVEKFSPYTKVKEPVSNARAAARQLLREKKKHRKRVYLYINNRLEGNALETIKAVIGGSSASTAAKDEKPQER